MSERTRPATPAERLFDVKRRTRAIEYGFRLGLHTEQKRDELIAALDDFDGYPRPLPPIRDRARLRARFVNAGRPRLRARVRKPTRPQAAKLPIIVQVFVDEHIASQHSPQAGVTSGIMSNGKESTDASH